jgi:hypothetical protein
MSKIITYKGIIAEGLEEKIKLSTLDGKRGYRINKFQTIIEQPGVSDYETTTKIYKKPQGAGSTTIDFTESDLLAVTYMEDTASHVNIPSPVYIIMDQEVFNQDIYVSTASVTGTPRVNYYIELETVSLSDTQTTQLTLKNLRAIASREP